MACWKCRRGAALHRRRQDLEIPVHRGEGDARCWILAVTVSLLACRPRRSRPPYDQRRPIVASRTISRRRRPRLGARHRRSNRHHRLRRRPHIHHVRLWPQLEISQSSVHSRQSSVHSRRSTAVSLQSTIKASARLRLPTVELSTADCRLLTERPRFSITWCATASRCRRNQRFRPDVTDFRVVVSHAPLQITPIFRAHYAHLEAVRNRP